jgi:hypothetical protein
MVAVIMWTLLATCAGPHGHARGHVAEHYKSKNECLHAQRQLLKKLPECKLYSECISGEGRLPDEVGNR